MIPVLGFKYLAIILLISSLISEVVSKIETNEDLKERVLGGKSPHLQRKLDIQIYLNNFMIPLKLYSNLNIHKRMVLNNKKILKLLHCCNCMIYLLTCFYFPSNLI